MGFVVQAQEEEKTKRNDIGFSARIFNNPAAPFVIMYKRQLKPILALRFGMGLQFNSQKTNSSDNITSNYQSSSSFSPSVGIELQKHFEKKWMFYGGGDVRGILSWSRSENISNNLKTNELLGSQKGLSLSPFIGLRFNVLDQLYFATEANLTLNYFESISTSRDLVSGTSATNKAYSHNAALAPAVGLFCFYRF